MGVYRARSGLGPRRELPPRPRLSVTGRTPRALDRRQTGGRPDHYVELCGSSGTARSRPRPARRRVQFGAAGRISLDDPAVAGCRVASDGLLRSSVWTRRDRLRGERRPSASRARRPARGRRSTTYALDRGARVRPRPHGVGVGGGGRLSRPWTQARLARRRLRGVYTGRNGGGRALLSAASRLEHLPDGSRRGRPPAP